MVFPSQFNVDMIAEFEYHITSVFISISVTAYSPLFTPVFPFSHVVE